jgi:hypothetical protein
MAEEWASFKMPSDEETDPPRCEMCQLLLTTFVTGVEQLLHMSLWLDRSIRFGKSADNSEIVGKIQHHQAALAESWQNLLQHREAHT